MQPDSDPIKTAILAGALAALRNGAARNAPVAIVGVSRLARRLDTGLSVSEA